MASRRTLDKRRSCLDKKRYQTQEEAQAAAADYVFRFLSVRPVDTYRCRHGRHYHIGHPKQRFSIGEALSSFPMKVATG